MSLEADPNLLHRHCHSYSPVHQWESHSCGLVAKYRTRPDPVLASLSDLPYPAITHFSSSLCALFPNSNLSTYQIWLLCYIFTLPLLAKKSWQGCTGMVQKAKNKLLYPSSQEVSATVMARWSSKKEALAGQVYPVPS